VTSVACYRLATIPWVGLRYRFGAAFGSRLRFPAFSTAVDNKVVLVVKGCTGSGQSFALKRF
jgi:hypothetical protein